MCGNFTALTLLTQIIIDIAIILKAAKLLRRFPLIAGIMEDEVNKRVRGQLQVNSPCLHFKIFQTEQTAQRLWKRFYKYLKILFSVASRKTIWRLSIGPGVGVGQCSCFVQRYSGNNCLRFTNNFVYLKITLII